MPSSSSSSSSSSSAAAPVPSGIKKRVLEMLRAPIRTQAEINANHAKDLAWIEKRLARMKPYERHTLNLIFPDSYAMQLVDSSTAAADMTQILEQVQFIPGEELPPMRMYGKTNHVQRNKAFFSDFKANGAYWMYRYNAGEWPKPLPMPPIIRKYQQLILEATGKWCNHAVINQYINGEKYIGDHRDDYRDLDPNSCVFTVSFGQIRTFRINLDLEMLIKHSQIDPKKYKSAAVREKMKAKKNRAKALLELYNRMGPEVGQWHTEMLPGMLVAIGSNTNEIYKHGLPKRVRKINPLGMRISITFRTSIVSSDQVTPQQGKKKPELFPAFKLTDSNHVPSQFVSSSDEEGEGSSEQEEEAPSPKPTSIQLTRPSRREKFEAKRKESDTRDGVPLKRHAEVKRAKKGVVRSASAEPAPKKQLKSASTKKSSSVKKPAPAKKKAPASPGGEEISVAPFHLKRFALERGRELFGHNDFKISLAGGRVSVVRRDTFIPMSLISQLAEDLKAFIRQKEKEEKEMEDDEPAVEI